VYQCASLGYFSLLKSFVEDIGCPLAGHVTPLLAKTGSVELLDWAVKNNSPWDAVEVLEVAAEAGHFDVLEWAVKEGLWASHQKISRGAAKSGNIEIVKFTIARECPVYSTLPELAALHGHVELFKFLEKGYTRIFIWRDLIQKAAEGGFLEMLNYLWDSHADSFQRASFFFYAGKNNPKREVIEWALERKIPKEDLFELPNSLLHAGDMDFLNWALENGFKISRNDAAKHAVECQNLDVLIWAKDHGAELRDPLIYDHAARAQNVPAFNYACQAGCPINESVVQRVARSGNIGILKLLIQNFGDRARLCLPFFVSNPCVDSEFLTWATEQGWSTKKNSLREAYHIAGRLGKLDILIWLRERYPAAPEELMISGISSGNIKIVKWIKSEGLSLPRTSLRVAAGEGHFKILRWLLQQGVSPKISSISQYAKIPRNFGNTDVFEWLLKEKIEFFEEFYDRTMQEFLDRRDWNAVRWFVAHGVRIPEFTTRKIMHSEFPKLKKWLQSLEEASNDPEQDTAKETA
jgi:hypothetical protein